jgi:methionyl-tRNA formyltransferase
MKLDGTRLVFMGTPEFAVAPLQALTQAGARIVGVVTAPDRPAGRGKKVRSSPVKQFALDHLDCPLFQPEKLKDPSFVSDLSAVKADLFVVVAFRMLPEIVWSIPPKGTFNLHASLLPDYRGAAPINHVLINGETMTGVTTFLIDQAIDTGNILLRKEVPVSPDDNAGTLHDKLMAAGAPLVVETAALLAEGTIEARAQEEFIAPGEMLHTAPKINRDDCRVDWTASASTLRNFIRGLSPYPGAWSELRLSGTDPVSCKLLAASVSKSEHISPPGRIVTDGRSLMEVGTAEGTLIIEEIQMAGKRRMKTGEFIRGMREQLAGARFE